jgi:hypothetical protein
VLHICQLKVTWLTAAKADVQFELLLEDYTIETLQKVLVLGHVSGGVDDPTNVNGARFSTTKARFMEAMGRRASLATTEQQLTLEMTQVHSQHAAMMHKIQRSPEPGSGLESALVEARMRLNTLLLERAYSQMALCTARALVVRLQSAIAVQPTLDRAASKKGLNMKGKNKGEVTARCSKFGEESML